MGVRTTTTTPPPPLPTGHPPPPPPPRRQNPHPQPSCPPRAASDTVWTPPCRSSWSRRPSSYGGDERNGKICIRFPRKKRKRKKKSSRLSLSLSPPGWPIKKDGLLQRKRKKKRGERGIFSEERRSGGKWKSEWTIKNRFSMAGGEKGRREESLMLCQQSITSSISLSLSLVETLEAESTVWKSAEEISPIFREKNGSMPSGHFRDCEIPASSSASSSKASQEIGEGPPPSLAETFLRLGHPPSPYNPGFQSQAKAPCRWEERRRRRTFSLAALKNA